LKPLKAAESYRVYAFRKKKAGPLKRGRSLALNATKQLIFKLGGKVIFFGRMLQGTARHFRQNKPHQRTVILIDRKNAGNPVWSAKTKHNQTANRKQVILGISYGR
jgi:hypothetical protein